MCTKLIAFFVILVFHKSCTQIALIDDKQTSALELVIEAPPLIFVSTLYGSIFAIDQQTGDIKWKFKDEPVIKVPFYKEPGSRVFLPDPKDAVCADSKKRHHVFSYDNQELQMCPIDRTRTIFVDRTKYKVVIFDSLRTEKHWNIRFYDYKSIYMNTQEDINYEYSHLATNSVGRVLTLNKHSSTIMWQQDFDSPVVAMYIFQGDVLVSIPFTTVALDTLEMLKDTSNGGDRKLSPTLYVGQHEHRTYGLPSLIDNTVTATTPMEKRLLTKKDKNKSKSNLDVAKKALESCNPLDFILGHYELPEESQEHLHFPGRSVSGRNNIIETEFTMNASTSNEYQSGALSALYLFIEPFIYDKFLSLFAATMFCAIICYYIVKKKWNDLIQHRFTDRIGKIELSDRQLGAGCIGTFVFYGRFEGNPVAVKRLLLENFTIAGREIDLLRKADKHPNVIRYFCDATDKNFIYIAIELCAATLEDYVSENYGQGIIKDVDILKQATSGLAHLHSLSIVHRDMKPRNILLSHVNNLGRIIAKISDFGLCKKLEPGRDSFALSSGITGTLGWMAPEISQRHVNATCSVDIFSMGCVFYYVVSKGKHPFGETYRRQPNIEEKNFDLEDLHGNYNAILHKLISTMISHDPNERPNATTVLKHPFFWDATRDELNEKVVRTGNIETYLDRVLGNGCEGTFVFYGRFEGKSVAVKRLLLQNFTVADREIDSLRESDEHPNVIRYFCNETDSNFRYIAIELCAATLEDYVSENYGQNKVKDVDILAQATSGLAHLHSLSIVHRDIKPHNILLSYANNLGHIIAKLSDFGFCKKVQRGRHSFSHRSGITGTDGWMAPEILQPNVKATRSVDIFSMGCVFYYVLSKGKHPFGDTLRRPANILSGEFNLEYLHGNAMLSYLISTMISHDPNKRPNTTTVLKHPFFWDPTRNELDEKVVRTGKIDTYLDRVLGKGCEDTSVFYGRFEGKSVAVKRLLLQNFTVADREIDLLRESDEHPNVIRYFCTEMDRHFTYIATELCDSSLEDYVLGKYGQGIIKDADILQQATSGLAHLHYLEIVHRDIKPQNILLSVSQYGHIRAKLSDFGLCKKLEPGRHSFSQSSDFEGTYGWMAPEMMKSDVKLTYSVDIFSIGCVFYYVLSKGKHPFGDILRRQANILCGEFNLVHLHGNENALVYNLISTMISHDPNERPNATTVLKHPFFWDATRVLTFFQEVSDIVVSNVVSNYAMQSLEASGTLVVRNDWRRHVDEKVASELRKYRGQSVKDLMRAIRNYKHHYRDLTEDARKILGEVPEQFLHYWTSRFPLLLIHSWLAMQCVKHEKLLKEYYDRDFIFKKNYSMSLSASDSFIPDFVEEFDIVD